MLSPNIIIPFDGNHANVPAGFTRDTRFDGKFPKGTASGWGDSGGAATHTHTFAHVHAIASHRHTHGVSGRINGNTHSMGMNGDCVEENHNHFGTAYTGYSQGQTCQSTAATLTAQTHTPPFYEVIFIKSSAYNAIPVNGMVLHAGANRPGLTYHTASENKFLKGAAAGGNAGGIGGATSHAHAQSHTHAYNAHYHHTGGAGFEQGRGEDGMSSPGLTHGNPDYGQHAFNVNESYQDMYADSTNSDTTSVVPLHKTIKHYKATQQTLPQPGDIAMITEATNPPGWITCDGTDGTPDLRGYFIKNTQTVGTIAGANTHTHTHTHYHSGYGSHAHTAYNPMNFSGDQGGHNGSGRTGVTSHQHNVTNPSQYVTANYDSTTTTSSETNNEPEYVKVRFIQLKYTVAGGALLSLL